ncbi:hypothetical protein E4U50_005306 [Claviceps purpurea]|nr:hypothetical protein E4U50_005306 [Claviceps purpurea]
MYRASTTRHSARQTALPSACMMPEGLTWRFPVESWLVQNVTTALATLAVLHGVDRLQSTYVQSSAPVLRDASLIIPLLWYAYIVTNLAVADGMLSCLTFASLSPLGPVEVAQERSIRDLKGSSTQFRAKCDVKDLVDFEQMSCQETRW